METKNIILIAIGILVIALIAVGIYSFSETGNLNVLNATNDSNTTNFIDIGTINANDTNDTNNTNDTVVGDNSPRENATGNSSNATYKVYNPQSDSYVPVIGEKFDEEVNRWYTYDADGVRYYNTRIN